MLSSVTLTKSQYISGYLLLLLTNRTIYFLKQDLFLLILGIISLKWWPSPLALLKLSESPNKQGDELWSKAPPHRAIRSLLAKDTRLLMQVYHTTSGSYSLPGRLMRHPSSLSGIVDQKEILAPHDRSKCPLHVSPSNAWLEEKEGTAELFSPVFQVLKTFNNSTLLYHCMEWLCNILYLFWIECWATARRLCWATTETKQQIFGDGA